MSWLDVIREYQRRGYQIEAVGRAVILRGPARTFELCTVADFPGVCGVMDAEQRLAMAGDLASWFEAETKKHATP